MAEGKQYHIGCTSSPQKYHQFENIFLSTLSTFLLEDKSWYGQEELGKKK